MMKVYKEYATSITILLSYFFNFLTFGIKYRLDKYENLFLLSTFGYTIWILVCMLQFAFVSYQLICKRIRTSSLLQEKVALPYILNQFLLVCYCISLFANMLFPAVLLITYSYFLVLCILLRIIEEFKRRMELYKLRDYFLIQLPMALLAGWLTIFTFVIWNTWFTQWSELVLVNAAAYQLSLFVISLLLIVQTSVLYSGLPQIMDPFIQIPLLWCLTSLAVQWYKEGTDLTLAVAIILIATVLMIFCYFLVTCFLIWRIGLFSKFRSAGNDIKSVSSTSSMSSAFSNI